MKRQNIQPDSLAVRTVGGHVLYSHVVVVEGGGRTVYVAGQLARDKNGSVVGAGDMAPRSVRSARSKPSASPQGRSPASCWPNTSPSPSWPPRSGWPPARC